MDCTEAFGLLCGGKTSDLRLTLPLPFFVFSCHFPFLPLFFFFIPYILLFPSVFACFLIPISLPHPLSFQLDKYNSLILIHFNDKLKFHLIVIEIQIFVSSLKLVYDILYSVSHSSESKKEKHEKGESYLM